LENYIKFSYRERMISSKCSGNSQYEPWS